MTLRLTPEILEGAYEYLRVTPPFKNWRLPHADEVTFVISRERKSLGYHRGARRDLHSHEIGICEHWVGSTPVLIRVMAHEMIHQYQQRNRTETANTEHNAEFGRLAKLVCRHHGWDWREF